MGHKTISQKGFLKGTKTIESLDNDTIIVKENDGNITREFPIRYDNLEKFYRRHRYVPYDWTFGSVLFSLFSLIFIYIILVGKETNMALTIFFLVFFLILSVACFIFLLKERYDCIIYHNMYSGENLVLYTNKPSKKEFSDYVLWLSKKISKSHEIFDSYKAIKASEEIFKLSELLEKGMLSSEEFGRLKNDILGNKQEPTVNLNITLN